MKEESELEAMLELGEGFGIRRAAVDMKFGEVLLLLLLLGVSLGCERLGRHLDDFILLF